MFRTDIRPIGRWKSAVVAAALLLTAAACSDGADAAATTTSSPATTATTTTTPAPAVMTVTAVDYGFGDLTATVAAGTEIALVNESDVELHEFVAIRLPDDETRSTDELLQLPPEELAAFFPLVETVIIAPPGAAGFPVEGTGALTEPGRYLVICAIPTGADPQEYMDAAAEAEGGPPEVPGGPPHFVSGMFAELTVTG